MEGKEIEKIGKILKEMAKYTLKKEFEDLRRKFKELATNANIGGIEADKVFQQIFTEAAQEYSEMLSNVLPV